jgi:hypothetical protein
MTSKACADADDIALSPWKLFVGGLERFFVRTEICVYSPN